MSPSNPAIGGKDLTMLAKELVRRINLFKYYDERKKGIL
jgi:hypothetical protein